MRRTFLVRSVTLVAVIVGIVGLSLALANAQGNAGQRGPKEEPLQKSNKPDKTSFRPVILKYVGGADCIDVRPPMATIWETVDNKKKRHNGIQWIVIDSSLDDAYWEIRWDNQSSQDKKDDASSDYFGHIDIPCGNNINQATPDTPSIENAKWPYKVEVFTCKLQDNKWVKDQSLCSVDPRIVWRR